MNHSKLIQWVKDYKWTIITIAFLAVIGIGYYALLREVHPCSDDYARRYSYLLDRKISSVDDVITCTWDRYLTANGRLVCHFYELLFIGLFDSYLWYTLATSIIFVIFLIACAYLYGIRLWLSAKALFGIIVFTILVWFFIPAPCDVLFWRIGSVDYLWMGTASLLYLCLFFRFKDENSSLCIKCLLAITSVYLGMSETISVVSICGAFVVYYLFHIREIKGNVVPLVFGFAIGAAIVVFGPGNFVRYAVDKEEVDTLWSVSSVALGFNIKLLPHYISLLFVHYKAAWMLVISMTILFFKKREYLKQYCKDNQLLLYAVFWGIIAFSVVFKPSPRALFFPEVMSLVLLFRLWMPLVSEKWLLLLSVIGCTACCVDYSKAYSAMTLQNSKYQGVMREISENNGEICFEGIKGQHRTVLPIYFEEWGYRGVRIECGVDTLILHPLHYCTMVPEDYICVDENRVGEYIYIYIYIYMERDWFIVRIPDTISRHRPIICKMQYRLPQSSKRDIAEKLHLYTYNKQVDIMCPKVEIEANGYDYYFIRPFSNPNKTITNTHIVYE